MNSKFSYSKEEEERRNRENKEALQYIKKLTSNTELVERSKAIEAQEWLEGMATGQYFHKNKFGVYDVLPKRYRDSQTYQDMKGILDGVDLSDEGQRNIALTKLGKYMGEHDMYYDSEYMKKNKETGMVQERGVNAQERDPKYTDFDLQLVTDAYSSLMTAQYMQDQLEIAEQEAPYRDRGEQEAREAAEASGKYTFENNQVGALNAVISDTQGRIDDLEYELSTGIASRGAAYYWITGQDINQVIADTQKELEEEQKYLEVLQKMVSELTYRGYDPNYMMHTYVGGVKGTAEAYIEDEEKKAEELQRAADLIYEGEGYEDLVPEQYRGLSYEQILEKQIAQDEVVEGLKGRAWEEQEGVKKAAIEGKIPMQEDFEEGAEAGKNALPEITAFDEYGEEKEVVWFINNGEYAQMKLAGVAAIGADAKELSWSFLNDHEKKIIRYYAANEDYEGIKGYLEAISGDLQGRKMATIDEMVYEFSEEYPALGIVVSTVSGVVQFPGFLYSLGVAISNEFTGEGRPVDPNSIFFMPARVANKSMEGATANMSPAGQWLTETIVGTVQSLGITAMSGGAAPFIMASNAAAQASFQASQIEGISARDVALIGMAAGTIEYLTEKVGVDSLLKTIGKGNKISKTMIKEMLKQGGIEASEELTSEIANTIAERVILGRDSEYEQYVSELLAEGYSREQAEDKANKEFFWNRPIQAAITGFVSGGLSSGAVHVYNTVVTPDGRNTGTSNLSQNDMISQEANERFGEIGQQAYQAMWEQMTSGQNMSQNLGDQNRAEAEAYQNLLNQSKGVQQETGAVEQAPTQRKGIEQRVQQPISSLRNTAGEMQASLGRRQGNTLTQNMGQAGRRMGQNVNLQTQQNQVDPRLETQQGNSLAESRQQGQRVENQLGQQESMKARRVPELNRNDVNIVLRGELTEAYLKKTGKSMKEFLRQVEGANEVLLEGRNRLDRQRTVESLMADEVLRNVEAGEVKSPEGKRDFKYLEQKRETSLTRKKLDRRLEEYERREAGAVEALRTERGLGQAELGQLPAMQEQQGPVGMREENIDRGGEGSYDGNWKYNDATSGIESGLTPEKAQEIVKTPKGKRPDPSTYLSKEYIDAHLSQFNEGVSIIMTNSQYERFIQNKSFIGHPDGTQFVLPKKLCDEIGRKAQGRTSIYEDALGHDRGHYAKGGGLVRIDIESVDGLNLRIPSGNEAGANAHWIPGGKTDGGIPEAITDLIKKDSSQVKITELK